MRAVQFDRYGGVEELYVADLPTPELTTGRALVRVRAAGLNTGEIMIREGRFAGGPHERLPCGQGTDFAGEIVEVMGDHPEFEPGQAVLGWSDERSAQAELVCVPATQIVAKPDVMSWETAGCLFGSSMAAVAGVQAVGIGHGDLVVVSAAAGGVGSIACQLARLRGADVIGIAGPDNEEWLASHGVITVAHGEGVRQRIRAATVGRRVSAFIDTFGAGYVDLALELGLARERIATTIDFEAADQHAGVQIAWTSAAGTAEALSEMAQMVARGQIEVRVAATFGLDDVQNAYRVLASRHALGKLVLLP